MRCPIFRNKNIKIVDFVLLACKGQKGNPCCYPSLVWMYVLLLCSFSSLPCSMGLSNPILSIYFVTLMRQPNEYEIGKHRYLDGRRLLMDNRRLDVWSLQCVYFVSWGGFCFFIQLGFRCRSHMDTFPATVHDAQSVKKRYGRGRR